MQHFFDGLHGRVGGGFAVGQTQFDSGHQTQTAHGDLQFGIGNLRLSSASRNSAEFRAAFGKFALLNFLDLRQRHRAANGMAEEGAGMNRLAARRRPCGVHQVGATDAGRKRKTAGERLAQTNQIGHDAGVFAGKPFSGAAKAGVNFIENQQRPVFVANFRSSGRNSPAEH